MRIVLLRHGQTDLNKKHLIQGSSVDHNLTVQGREFALRSAEKFHPEKFDLIYSSPLKRAQETANIFVKGKKEILLDDRIKERDFGEWDAKNYFELRHKYPDAFDQGGHIGPNYLKYAPHGETRQHLESRVASFLDDLYQRASDKKVLIVCHGTLARMMTAHYLTHGDMSIFDSLKNCALVAFNVDEHGARLSYYNRLLV